MKMMIIDSDCTPISVEWASERDLLNAHYLVLRLLADPNAPVDNYPMSDRYWEFTRGDRAHLEAAAATLAEELEDRAFEPCPRCRRFAGMHMPDCR